MPKYSINRLWILSHFEWIFANRSKIKTRPCANFIVTGFVINAFACQYYAYKIDKITLGNLIDLWEKGFIYKGFPLIHYRMSYGDNSTNIAFLLRKLALIALANFASVTCPLNSLSLPRLLIKWFSPVVQKQHFEVIFVSPAFIGEKFSLIDFYGMMKKNMFQQKK